MVDQNDRLTPYLHLLRKFIDDRIDAAGFEHEFLQRYKRDSSAWTPDEFAVLENIFVAADAYCADSNLRGARDISEDQLRVRCAVAYDALKRLAAA